MPSTLGFVFSDKVREIFDHFTALFGIRIAYYGPDGNELEVGLGRPWCEYCALLRNELGDDELCRESDAARRTEALNSGRRIDYTCHGGLFEAVIPLFVDSNPIGFVMIGQVRTEAAAPQAKLRRWEKLRADRSLAASFAKVPLRSRAELSHILVIFSALVDLIVACHLIEMRGQRRIDLLLDHLRRNCAEDLSLPEAASFLGLSPWRLAHVLKESLGKTFKGIQAEIRMDKADELLAALP
ncbi:MAG: PocR ligand-binding domain-containing protein, partial [Treponema sp.]|nr:PocR ligand-binding domain-containing protein [Treponema sp.]